MNKSINFIYNFRDLGGIKSKDGRKIKAGFFYRGGPLVANNDVEKSEIDNLNLKVIIDFRSISESDQHESVYIPKTVEYHRQSALLGVKTLEDDNFDLTANSSLSEAEIQMYEIYKNIFFNNLAFKLGMKYIENFITPIYFNCSAGKDRTGTFASLILLLLDVEDEEIYKEYERSNDWLRKKFNNFDELPSLAKVNRDWLKAGIDEIKKRYNTIDEYLLKEYGINNKKRQEIKNFYLEGEQEK